MTLILTTRDSGGVIQVVDRLVTLRSPSGPKPWDTRANKTVLFFGRDGVFTLSYAGLAYLNDLPTDEWIAQTLLGTPLTRNPDGRPTALCFRTVPLGKWPSVGQAIQRLGEELYSVMPRLKPKHLSFEPLTIVIAGWQIYKRKRPRSFGMIIEKPVGSGLPAGHGLPRYAWRQIHLCVRPDGYLSNQERINLLDSIAQTPLQADELMIAELRRIARKYKGVGNHCMVIFLPSPQRGCAQISYDSPDRQTAHLLISKQHTRAFPIAFTPWIVSEDVVQSPSIHSGGDTELQCGPWRVEITGTTGSYGIGSPLSVHSSEHRRPKP
jgi:hypothetical protein